MQGILKGNFRSFINDCKFRSFSQGDDIFTQNSNIPLNATHNTGNTSYSSLFISSNNSEEKNPLVFSKRFKDKKHKRPHN